MAKIMRIGRFARALTACVVLGAALPELAQAADAQGCDQVTLAERVIALQSIQNLMGRYSHISMLDGEGALGNLFALKTPGVSWRTPRGVEGIAAVKARLKGSGRENPTSLREHSLLTPIIEIAGDGQTAKGVWDSFGPSISGIDAPGYLMWMKYGVDFIREDGQWKIWHMQLFGVAITPHNQTITESARERQASGKAVFGETNKPGWTAPRDLWIYDGVKPPRGPRIPVPYCTFDPKDSFGDL
jgi:hypothetical protein